MAQGISRGSREAQQFLKDSFQSKHQGIEGKGYKERAEFGDNVLRSLFGENELFHFKKTMLKNRAAEDRTHTIEAVEHKAEAMLNGLKAHAEDSKMAMHAITSIKSVLSGISPSEVNAIKNPLLRNLATIKHGLGNKKEAAASFAHQVLSNPTYFFGDAKQAKSFINLFLKKNGLGRLGRMLRGRGQRRLQRVMDRLAKMSDGFDKPSVKTTGSDSKQSSISSQKTPRVDAKERSGQPAGNIPPAAVVAQPGNVNNGAAANIPNPPPPPPIIVNGRVVNPVANIPPAPGQAVGGKIPPAPPPPPPPGMNGRVNPASNIPPMPVGIRDQSLEGLAKELEALGVNPNDHLDVSGVSVDDLDRMMAELEGIPAANIPPARQQAEADELQKSFEIYEERMRQQREAIESAQQQAENTEAYNASPEAAASMEELDRMMAELEGNPGVPAVNIPPAPPPPTIVNGRVVNPVANIPPAPGQALAGNIPPAPPPPPPGNIFQPAADRARGRVELKGEDIQDINELVPLKPATANSRPSLEKCAVSPAAIGKVAPAIFESLSMERILKLSPEHIVRLTAEQQAALSPELIGDICYKAAKEGRLSFNEQQETKLCRKLLVGLDPDLVRAKLQASSNRVHADYLKENNTGGRITTAVERLYRTIRREDFGLPYQNNEAISRLSPEQLAASVNKQVSDADASRNSLLDNINQGGFKLNKVPDKSKAEQGSNSDNTAQTGSVPFNASLLNRAQNNQPKTEVEKNDKVEGKEPAGDAIPEDENIDEFEDEKSPAQVIQDRILENATSSIKTGYGVVDFEKNETIGYTIRECLNRINEEIEKLKEIDPDSKRNLEVEKNTIERTLLGLLSVDEFVKLKVAASRAAREAASSIVAEGMDSGETEENIQAEANAAAQEAAQKAVETYVQEAVRQRSEERVASIIQDREAAAANRPAAAENQEHKIEEGPMATIMENAIKPIDTQFTENDIKNNQAIKDTIRQSLEAINEAIDELRKLDKKASVDFKEKDINATDLTVFRGQKQKWLKAAQLAAKEAVLRVVEEGRRLAKTEEDIQVDANAAAKASAEEAIIKYIQDAVKQKTEELITPIESKRKVLARQKSMDNDDEEDVDDWDD